MATAKSAWGIEIGASALKAIRLVREGESVVVTDFTVIPHQQVLSAPDVDPAAMVRFTLGQFLAANGEKLKSDRVVVSVAGRDAFARFAKLPVGGNLKNLAKLIDFESKQQIPFPIDQVEWDYQAFKSEDNIEVDVGIFAITKDRIGELLTLYRECGLNPDVITIAPNAVFNAVTYDLNLDLSSGPVMVVDVGTNATDIVVAERGIGWMRSFPLGGHSFTEAISGGFDIPYKKAEKLKLEGAASKHAKQVMQRMKDTFDSLISEIRKSKDYYESTHPGASVDKILGTGSTLKIPGLRKFITQQIGVEVERLDEFKRIQLDGDQAADFAANAMGLVVAYGLALQGVGLGAINVNLVPMAVRRERAWMAKGKWFAAAAGLGLVISGMLFIRPITGRSGLGSSPPASVESTISQGKAFKAQFDELSGAGANGGAAQNMLSLVDYRNVWPHLVNDVYTALAAANPQPALLGGNVDEIKAIPVAERRLVTLDELGSAYVVPGADGKRRIRVSMKVSLSHADPGVFLNKEKSVAGWLRANADRADVPYVIVADSIKIPDDWTEIEFGKGARQKPDAPAGGAASGGSDFGAPASGDAASNANQGQGNKGMQGRRKPPAGGGQMPGMGQGLGLSGGGEGAGEGSGDGSTGGAGGADWSSGSDAASKSRRKTGGAATGAEAESIKVLEEARIGEAPSIYQPDDVYFVGEVTFEVELRDPKGAPAAAPAEGTQ
ncbi:MAG: putative type pilus assembly protein PilM [Planctomycetota bacterium]|jgi:type IV pilus assembly protein PilM